MPVGNTATRSSSFWPDGVFGIWRATVDTFRTFLASEDHKNQCLEPG